MGCNRPPGEAGATHKVHPRRVSGYPSHEMRGSAHGVLTFGRGFATARRVSPAATAPAWQRGRMPRDPHGHLRAPVEPAQTRHPTALPLAGVTRVSEINPTCDAELALAPQSRGRPESDTWGTRARQTLALARRKQSRRAPGSAGSGIPASGLSPAQRLGIRGTDLPDMSKGLGREPREEAGETVPVPPGHPQRGPASLHPGREPRPRRGPERFPLPD